MAAHPKAYPALVAWIEAQRPPVPTPPSAPAADASIPSPAAAEVTHLTLDQKLRLAKDRSTPAAVLEALATDVDFQPYLSELARNPTTPSAVLRNHVYPRYPHLRSKNTIDSQAIAAPVTGYGQDADAAIASFRQRQVGAEARFAHRQAVTYPPTTARTNGFAVASLVLSLLGGSVLAIVFGHIAKKQIARTGEQGEGMATAGLVIGYICLVIAVIWIIVLVVTAANAVHDFNNSYYYGE